MLELVIDLTLTIDTSLSIGAGGSGGVLADKAVVRNRRDQLILPGSHLKGRLRHACEIIARSQDLLVCDAPRAQTMCPQLASTIPAPCVICQLFGSPAYAGPLIFNDLVYGEPVPVPTIRPGVSINRRRRTAEAERLFFIETSPSGGWVHFHHTQAIQGWLVDDAKAETQTHLLLAGLRFLQNWGGGKSRGLGWGQAMMQAHLGDRKIDLTAGSNGLWRLRHE